MKKLLIVILALAVAVGGYFVVNINWGALFESSSTLTEAEARSLVVEKVGGEIVGISYNDSATPYYVDAVNNGEITNTIKEKISSFVVKADGQEKELQPSKEENGYVFYEYEKDDKKIEIVVDEDELENLNSNIEIKSTEDGEEVTFSDEYEGNYVMIHSDIDIFQ